MRRFTRSRDVTRRRFLRTGAGALASAPAVSGSLAAFANDAARADVVAADGVQPGGTVRPNRAVGRPFPHGVSLDEAAPGFEESAADGPTLGIAVVGLGDFAIAIAIAIARMLPAISLSRHARIAGLVSGNPEKAARVAAAYGVPETAMWSYDDFDAIADDESVDAVYIVLPNALHAEFTERAFAAGKHVLCAMS